MPTELNQLKDDEEGTLRLIRHVVLNVLRLYNKNYGGKYGEIVIACDSKNYWRRDIFPFYKAARAKEREDSDYNWKHIFNGLNNLKSELVVYFPYKVIEIEKVEADDIIAVLAKHSQEPVLIASNDHDFQQLYKYPHVRQVLHSSKKIVTIDDPNRVLLEHIIRGDRKDGVPGILGDDDVFVNISKRQGRLTAKKMDKYLSLGYDACENDYQRENWKRNQQLVDFDFIPKEIEDNIIDKYNTAITQTNRGIIMDYLVKYRCNLLIENLDDF